MDNNYNNMNQNNQNIQNGMNYSNNSSPNNFNYQNQSINTNQINNDLPNKKSKKPIMIIIAIVIIGVLGFLGYKFLFNKDSSANFDITYSTSFFIKNSDDKYALFNDDGKQLTDFIYTSVSNFVNGTAIVKTEDDKVGIISSNGKMTVDFGKYEYITSSAGLYKVHGEDYHYILIDGNGKMLYDLEDADIDTFLGSNTYSILEKDNTFTVLNYNGTKMVSFPVVDGVDDPTTNEEDGYISVFYNNKNYILNVNTGKQIASFDSDKHFCVNNVQDNGKSITLNSCVSWFQSQNVTYYKLIQNGKVISFDSECDSIYYKNNQLICKKDYDEYLLDSNYKKSIEISSKAYLDNNTYVMNNSGSFNGVDFYNNGNVVKNVSCRTLKETGYMSNNIYILGTYYSRDCGTESGTYEYYKANGEKAFDKSFARAEVFDKNNLAKVSEDKTNYYLIDTNGKQVGGLYSSISLSNEYYIVTKDGKKGLMDKNGKEIIPCEYTRIDLTTKQNKIFATLITSDSKYAIYDIESAKEIITFDNSPSLYDHYINIKNNDKTQYYTYSGKMFFEL